jgi:hypothetical protein
VTSAPNTEIRQIKNEPDMTEFGASTMFATLHKRLKKSMQTIDKCNKAAVYCTVNGFI